MSCDTDRFQRALTVLVQTAAAADNLCPICVAGALMHTAARVCGGMEHGERKEFISLVASHFGTDVESVIEATNSVLN